MPLKTSNKVVDLQSHNTWTEIRKTNSYEDIIKLSNTWLLRVWDCAKALDITPHGKHVSAQCPKIFMSHAITIECVGMYYHYNHFFGPAIRISNPTRMFRSGVPLFDALRDTILHETQHAIDDAYSVWSANHGHWFDKRLAKLTELYPAESI